MSAFALEKTLLLNDGIKIPLCGLGTYKLTAGHDSINAIASALNNGYRLIDTAAGYGNEKEVGQAIATSGISRKSIFIVTKVNTNGHGYNECKAAFAESLKKLNSEYVDLYLIHGPHGGKLLKTYDAMLELKQNGLIRSVGVSNFAIHHLEELKKAGRPLPSVNQIELHPFLKEQTLVDYCKANNIALMAYCPIARNKHSDNPVLQQIAKKYTKTVPQVMIRWCLEQNYITIPRSSNEQRIIENSQVFDFKLEKEDFNAIGFLPNYRCTNFMPYDEPWEE